MSSKPIGQMHEKKALFLRKEVGSASNSDGREIKMSLVNGYIPMVEDVVTGRQWLLDWPSIVDLAIIEFDKPVNLPLVHLGPENG